MFQEQISFLFFFGGYTGTITKQVAALERKWEVIL